MGSTGDCSVFRRYKGKCSNSREFKITPNAGFFDSFATSGFLDDLVLLPASFREDEAFAGSAGDEEDFYAFWRRCAWFEPDGDAAGY
jgi:hypothetical protein